MHYTHSLLSLLSLLPFVLADTASAADTVTVPASYGSGQTVPASQVPHAAWVALNATLGGRLYAGVPYGRPCYNTYDSPLGVYYGADNATCETRVANSDNDIYRQDYFGAYIYSSEACLAEDQFCTYGQNSTDLSFYQGKTCYQGSVPTYYIDVRGASDVVLAYNFVALYNLQLSIKGAGHEWWGRSSGPGSLALWTYHLKDINYNTQFVPTGAPAGTASIPAVTLGAGVIFDEIYTFANQNNFTFLGGGCPGVGASGGYFMGGGIGALANIMGMGSDRVIEFKIVTPDGKLRTANAYQNTDLFFAVRGGGPATYGVVLETTHKVDPQYTLQTLFVFFNSSIPDVQRTFFEIVVNNTLTWANNGWGGYLFTSGISYVNPRMTAAQAAADIAPLTDYLNSLPSGSLLTGPAEIQSIVGFYDFEYVLMAPITLAGTTGSAGSAPAGRVLQDRHFNSDAAKVQTADVILDFIADLHQYDQGMPQSNFLIQTAGPWLYSKENPTAVNTTGLSPAWRNAIMYVEAQFQWGTDATVQDISNLYKAAHDSIAGLVSITPNVPGYEGAGYMNEGDMYATNWQQDFFGSHYNQLLQIKNKYDPHQLLKPCWKCVGWTDPNDSRFKCYFKNPGSV